MSNGLDPSSVGPGLGPSCLQRLSADDKNCNIVFSQTIGPIELKFHVKTPCDKLAKMYTKYFGQDKS